MQPRDVLAGRMGGDIFGLDLVERHRRGVDKTGILRAPVEHLARHDRAGIEADRAAREQIAPAHGDEIGAPGPAPMKCTVMACLPLRPARR
jgi:hypothetical protein